MADAQPIRVLVVDDHALVRSGLRLFLMGAADIALVGEAASGAEALRLCSQLQPDVVLMDMAMRQMDGVETTRRLLQQQPHLRVLALSSFGQGDLVQRALQVGAIGYLLKDVSGDELVRAIRATAAGQASLAPAVAGALVAAARQPQAPDYGLTGRQREVLALLAAGESNAAIARTLQLSLSTVRFHVSAILAKMGAANRAEAAALAVKHHLV